MKPFDIEAAKNGAPVCTELGEKVRIVCFDKKIGYPIIALVGDDETITRYSADGKTCAGQHLFMYEEPETQFKPFDRVLVRDDDEGVWNADFFGRKKEVGEFQFVSMGGQAWRYCIPYEGNERLLGTTDKPKGE